MKMGEHVQKLDGHDYSPRVIELRLNDGSTGFYAWTAEWEGPLRPDFQAAAADLRNHEARP